MSLERYQSLLWLASGEPLTTSQVAARLGTSLSVASRMLRKLEGRGLASNIRAGLWQIGDAVPDRLAIASAVTAPAPAYVSFVSALSHHGIIDQLPRSVELASTGRPRTIRTRVADYVVHRVPPELFSGWIESNGARIATPAKALFDIAYGAAVRGKSPMVPELDLPPAFDSADVRRWLPRVRSTRLRTLTERAISSLLERARE